MTTNIRAARIKALRLQHNMTQDELGEKIAVNKQLIYKYENGIITNIPSDKLEALAEVFGVSPAYLMGWDDSETDSVPDEHVQIKQQTTILLKEHNLTPAEAAAKIGISKSRLERPEFPDLSKIAQYFNVSTDWLLGNTSIRTPMETAAAHMIDPRHEFTEEEEEEIRSFIEYIKEKARKKREKQEKQEEDK